MSDSLARLQLAFTLHMAHQVLGADADFVASEHRWFRERFPPEMLRELGFVDAAGGYTAAWEEARDVALLELPRALHEADKLQIIEELVNAAASDGVLCAEESDALAHAARILGVGDAVWAEHLERLIGAGALRRDGCAAG